MLSSQLARFGDVRNWFPDRQFGGRRFLPRIPTLLMNVTRCSSHAFQVFGIRILTMLLRWRGRLLLALPNLDSLISHSSPQIPLILPTVMAPGGLELQMTIKLGQIGRRYGIEMDQREQFLEDLLTLAFFRRRAFETTRESLYTVVWLGLQFCFTHVTPLVSFVDAWKDLNCHWKLRKTATNCSSVSNCHSSWILEKLELMRLDN